MKKQFRPDLTEYEWLVEVLTEKLNEESINKMSKTDAVKICIERAVEKLSPEIKFKKTRKKYERLNF